MTVAHNDCRTCKIRDCSILKVCSNKVLGIISNQKQTNFISKEKHLFREGDTINGIYFIKSGILKLIKENPHSRSLILKFVKEGMILGYRELGLIAHHNTSAIAITDVQYCFIPLDQFHKILEDCDLLKEQALLQLIQELRETENKAFSLANKSVKSKVANALLSLSSFFNYDENSAEFEVNFNRQDIADWIATTKEQVSKSIKELERDAIIKSTGKKFVILDNEKLTSIAVS